ncbi:hypothetical protein Desor_5445 [Desulfosporosinus orientis DSM 765]|uniref:TIR domain-containing protein n=1 Tax=Desulfosporosinus orientis (strain ATCC 19365 / DSM 765 / NCIMB 8382 / VKM B-1628 / Singapore I) TaxID=768706 RepID=G7WG88_DESOD|nr:toll/interleukin-1 receptor domain-containing protein [Desulfosporosinus orientis]AET70820.1 hypothetical protein Desor_5445 [Desulfosporosinus orientis DSM 765]
MLGIFFAYSHKDKEKLYNLIENLNSLKNYCELIYYQKTLPEKNKKEDFFLKLLSEIDFFVVLLSDSSLESKYVQREISEAIRLCQCKPGNIKKIFPLIIDDTIDSSDLRIHEYIKQQNVFRPTSMKSAAKIIEEEVIHELSNM